MPNRIIKESICTSDTIDGLNWFQEVFFYRLMVTSDDYGRFDARLPILNARLFPLKNITVKDMQAALNALIKAGLIMLYESDGHLYGQITKWDKHQQIRNKRSRYPQPDINCNQLQSIDINCSSRARNPIQSESESESESKTYTSGASAPDSAFEALWKLYPKERREGKQHALKAYRAARKSGVTDETIRAGIEAYVRQIAARHTESRYVKTAGTWFFGQCWNDDYSDVPIPQGKQVGAQQYTQRTYTDTELDALDDTTRALMEEARKGDKHDN